MTSKKRRSNGRRTREAYGFILPGVLYMLVVVGYPIVYNFILSFKDTSVRNLATGTSKFIGFQNYIELFHNPTFILVLKNTFVFTIGSLIFQFTIGYLLALFFYKKFTLSGPIRGLMLIPYMMPMAVTGLLGQNLFFTVKDRNSRTCMADLYVNCHDCCRDYELLGGNSVQHASSDLRNVEYIGRCL